MKKVNLYLKLTPTECNGWPNLIIEFNKKVIFNQVIDTAQELVLSIGDCIDRNNQLIMGMNNKKFGKDRIWDTVTKDNKIIQDKTLKIEQAKLDDVDVLDILNKNLFRVNLVDQQPAYYPTKIYANSTMNYNGYFFINFDMPLYNSLTNQKFKQKKDENLSYFSNYTLKFHYEDEIKLIEKIEKKLKELDEKFSN